MGTNIVVQAERAAKPRRRTPLLAALARGWVLSCCLAPLPASIALGFDTVAEEAAVRKLIASAQAAYSRLDLEGLLGHYDDAALIVTYTMGRGDKAAFRRDVAADFSLLGRIEDSFWDVVSVTFENEVATAKVLSTEKAVRKSGEVLGRSSRYFYRLRKSGGTWKIYLQSYREDFGVTPIHGGPGGGPLHPGAPDR